MNELYFPSCNFTKDSPEAAKKIRAYLKERMPIAGCCRADKLEYPPESTSISARPAGKRWRPAPPAGSP